MVWSVWDLKGKAMGFVLFNESSLPSLPPTPVSALHREWYFPSLNLCWGTNCSFSDFLGMHSFFMFWGYPREYDKPIDAFPENAQMPRLTALLYNQEVSGLHILPPSSKTPGLTQLSYTTPVLLSWLIRFVQLYFQKKKIVILKSCSPNIGIYFKMGYTFSHDICYPSSVFP